MIMAAHSFFIARSRPTAWADEDRENAIQKQKRHTWPPLRLDSGAPSELQRWRSTAPSNIAMQLLQPLAKAKPASPFATPARRKHRTPIEMRDSRQFLRAICPRWQAPRVLMIVPGVPTERFGMDRRPTKALHLQNGQSRA